MKAGADASTAGGAYLLLIPTADWGRLVAAALPLLCLLTADFGLPCVDALLLLPNERAADFGLVLADVRTVLTCADRGRLHQWLRS